MKTFLDSFAAILGAVTVALLLISVSHEYGYFWEVGSRFQAFLATSDYFGNAVMWLPALLIILYAYLDWDVLLGFRTYQPFSFNWGGVVFILIVFGLPIVVFFYLSAFSFLTFLWPLVILWLSYGMRLLPFGDTQSEVLQQGRRAFLVVPVIMAFSFGWGINQGQSDLKSFAEPYTLQTKAGERLNRIILRTFDKGILVRDVVENRIELLKWDDIAKIYRFAPAPRDVPLSCSWFGVNCGVSTANP